MATKNAAEFVALCSGAFDYLGSDAIAQNARIAGKISGFGIIFTRSNELFNPTRYYANSTKLRSTTRAFP